MAERTGENGWTYSDDDWYEAWRKSDAELKIQQVRSTTTVLTGNPGFREEMDAKAKFAAASDVLVAREERNKTKESRVKAREKAEEEAYYRLKAAYTPNGQLVAAILEEEDGKTLGEIAGWCDELAALDTADFERILQDLKDDGILEKTGDKYYLNRICTKTLGFESLEGLQKWAARRIANKEGETGEKAIAEIREYNDPLMDIISSFGTASFYPEDLLKWIDYHNELVDYSGQGEELSTMAKIRRRKGIRADRRIEDGAVLGSLNTLVDYGILKTDGKVYWVPLLGEK